MVDALVQGLRVVEPVADQQERHAVEAAVEQSVGGVRGARPDPADRPDSTLDPDAIAHTYLSVLRQPRSAWSWEIELRPWGENF